MKPTVIHAGNNDDDKNREKPAVKPTVMKPSTPPPPEIPTRKPTVMVPTAIKPPVPLPAVVTPPSPPLVIKKPTAVAGFVLQRIQVTVADIEKENPGATKDALERALRIVLSISLDTLIERAVILWGHDLQKEYAERVNQSLKLSQSELISKVTGHINRMMEILELIDLKKVCGLEGRESAFTRLFKGTDKIIDTPEELEEALRELEQLRVLLDNQLDDLLKLKESFEEISNQILAIGVKVESLAMAAAFLAEYVQGKPQANLAPRFLERSGSLTQTLAQIRSSDGIREIQIDQPLRLVATVQNVALVMLSGWIGSIVSVQTMLQQARKPTVTEISEISDQTRKIITQLKG